MNHFFLHGFGSNANTFSRFWTDASDNKSYCFLDGPELDKFTGGRRWFPFTSQPDLIIKGLTAGVDYAQRKIESELVKQGLSSNSPLTLTGHSQGAMISFELFRQNALNITSVNCYAGFLPRSKTEKPISLGGKTAILKIFSSTIDRFIAHDEVINTYQYFRSISGVDVKHYQSTCIDHTFSVKWLDSNNFFFQTYENY